MSRRGKSPSRKDGRSRNHRPTAYDPRFPLIVGDLAKMGLIDKEIATRLGITDRTLRTWKRLYPELSSALKVSKDYVDTLVEGSLLKRAQGYTYEEVKQVVKQGEWKGADGRPATIARVEKTTKLIPPDVTAMIFWLKNRQPKRWRDLQQRELSGDLKGFTIVIAPEDKLP